MSNFVENILNSFVNNTKGNLTPTQQSYIDAIQKGDSQKGVELANNLCNSMGLSREEAVAQARQYFHI